MTSFCVEYSDARSGFVGAVRAENAAVEDYTHPREGPNGETLSVTTAWIGKPDARRVLVIASGTHGVEGVAGSGMQVEWLNRGGAMGLPQDTAVLLVHAVNPWGFAWHRRMTHENIDLNRNWIDFGNPVPVNPHYADISDLVLPDAWSDQSLPEITQALLQYAVTHGMPALTAAISGGQYQYPDGLFFGGTSPSWSRLVLTRIMTEQLRGAERVGIIDIHTGLGASGVAEQMVPTPADTEPSRRAARWFGAGVVPVGSADSTSTAISGDWISSMPGILSHAQVTGIALEIGTIAPMQVASALIADNWLHMRGDLASPLRGVAKRMMLGAFYQDDATWRGMAVGQMALAARNALAGLRSAAS